MRGILTILTPNGDHGQCVSMIDALETSEDFVGKSSTLKSFLGVVA